jgi:hypothetical protein
MVSAFEGLRDYDPTEATGGLTIPAVYIAADERQPALGHDTLPRASSRRSCTARP